VESAITRGDHVVIPPMTIAAVEVKVAGPPIRAFGASRSIDMRLVDDAVIPAP
jgi:hypothetical protein